MTWDDYLNAYEEAHRHPLNQLTHSIGIPLIVASLFIMPAAVVAGALAFWVGLAMFVVGWIFQFIGHAVEGNGPKFMQGPKFLLVGVYWCAIKFGLMKRPTGRTRPSAGSD